MRRAVALLGIVVAGLSAHSSAQETAPIAGDRLGGFVLPVEPLAVDVSLSALRGWTWRTDDTQRLLLEGDVTIRIGHHIYESESAVVWLNRLPSAGGLINQIALYFDNADNPSAQSGVAATGRRLLVTASTRGAIDLELSLRREGQPAGRDIIRVGEARLAQHLTSLTRAMPSLSQRPILEWPAGQPDFSPTPGGTIPADQLTATPIDAPTRTDTLPWLRNPKAMIAVAVPGTLEGPFGTDEYSYIATGGVQIEYVSAEPGSRFDRILLTARRAVIFTDPVPISDMLSAPVTSKIVRGIYLEGDVIASADVDAYILRAPKVYYDFRTGQAIMLDSLLRTHQRQIPMPVFARAQEMRQVADEQWEAAGVRVSTSEFFTPHIALGAEQMTITQRQVDAGSEDGETETYIQSRSNSLRVNDRAVLGWPRMAGTVRDIPLRSINLGSRDNDGLRILTTWDLFTLLGRDAPAGTDTELHLDAFTNRGAGIGVTTDYQRGRSTGRAELYGQYDEGIDRTSAGLSVDSEQDFRGVALWWHRHQLNNDWTLDLKASHISDPTYIAAWREEDYRERLQYETSVYLKKATDQSAVTFLGQYQVDDFLSNEYLLASRQYTVDRAPDVAFRHFGSFGEDGAWTYSGELRASRLNFAYHEPTARESGVRAAAFGMGPDASVRDAFLSRGFPDKWVSRVDTRHEIARPMQVGAVKVTPFFVGRLTAYDDDFQSFSSNADDTRTFGAAGVRIATQVSRVHNDVENRLFDLHRLRHIVEPSATLWYGHSDVSQVDLPEYDPEVESIGTGSAVRLGVRNTWQTKRGGPGFWRSVDVLTVDADVVIDSNDTDIESPVARFFDFRPEYSQAGDHFHGAMVWQVGDGFSLAGETVYDMERSEVALLSVGGELQHSPDLSIFVEYREIDAARAKLVDLGWNYRLSYRYRIVLMPQWDVRRDEFQAFDARIVRRFPDFNFTIRIRHDEIQGDTSFGASLNLVRF